MMKLTKHLYVILKNEIIYSTHSWKLFASSYLVFYTQNMSLALYILYLQAYKWLSNLSKQIGFWIFLLTSPTHVWSKYFSGHSLKRTCDCARVLRVGPIQNSSRYSFKKSLISKIDLLIMMKLSKHFYVLLKKTKSYPSLILRNYLPAAIMDLH